MPTASIKFTPEFMLEGSQRYWRQNPRRGFHRLLGLTAALFFAAVAVWQFCHGVFFNGVLMTAMSVYFLLFRRVISLLMLRRFRNSPFCDDDLTTELTEAGFHCHSAKQDVKLQWSVFSKVVRFEDGFLLFQGVRAYNWIPFSSLANPAELEELDALLRAKIPDYKMIGK